MSIFGQCETVREREKALKFCGVSYYGLKWPITNKDKLKYYGHRTTSSQNTAQRNAGKEGPSLPKLFLLGKRVFSDTHACS